MIDNAASHFTRPIKRRMTHRHRCVTGIGKGVTDFGRLVDGFDGGWMRQSPSMLRVLRDGRRKRRQPLNPPPRSAPPLGGGGGGVGADGLLAPFRNFAPPGEKMRVT
ncbi:hypothetical protein FKM82_029311 [Ascaphus truei]